MSMWLHVRRELQWIFRMHVGISLNARIPRKEKYESQNNSQWLTQNESENNHPSMQKLHTIFFHMVYLVHSPYQVMNINPPPPRVSSPKTPVLVIVIWSPLRVYEGPPLHYQQYFFQQTVKFVGRPPLPNLWFTTTRNHSQVHPRRSHVQGPCSFTCPNRFQVAGSAITHI